MRTAALAAAAIFLLVAWTPFPSAVGPEVPLDAPPFAPTFTTDPRLAMSDEGALLLSEELRVSRIGEIFSLHFTGPLDETGVPVDESSALGYVLNASVASSGRGYLVAFEQGGEARAVRFTSAGTRIDATPISLGVRGGVGEVAWDGSAYVVIAASKAISVAEDGRVLATRDAFHFATNAQVAARNGVTVVVNQGGNSDLNGPLQAQVIGGALHRLGSGASSDIAAGDPGFLLVYESSGAIAGRLFDPSGQPDGPQFQIASGGRDPVVAWSGTDWIVAYELGETVRAVRVLRGPVGNPAIVTTNGTNPSVAAHRGKVVVAWDNRVPRTISEIRTATIDGTQVNATTTAAGRTSHSQTDVRMTTVDGATLLAWYDGAARVRRMDGTSSAAHTIADVGNPMTLAGGDGAALLITRLGNTLAFTRVDRNGAPLGTQRFTTTALVDFVDAAWIGDQWAVVWHTTGLYSGLYRATVHADGTLATPRPFGPLFAVTTQGLTVTAANGKAFVLWSVAGGGTLTFLIDGNGVWSQGRSLSPGMFEAASAGGTDVLVARVHDRWLEWQRVLLNGTLAARGEVPLPEAGMALQTFFTGENYLLLLTKTNTAPDRIDLYGLRVTIPGAPIDPAPVRFGSVYTVLPPALAGATLRNGTTLDLAYFRALDEAGLFHQFPRLVFRSVHDSPRRRVVR